MSLVLMDRFGANSFLEASVSTETSSEIGSLPEIVPKRKITGMSAILLPFRTASEIDWDGFDQHFQRTIDVGLVPAVNMDTGYANLIDEDTRSEVLRRSKQLADGRDFVAGVFVADGAGATFNPSAYQSGIDAILAAEGTPILFQSYGLIGLPDDQLVDAYVQVTSNCDAFLFFELGKVFAPFGRIYSLDVYEQLMRIPSAVGAKHSSLRRDPEWRRLKLRDRVRPEFKVLTGNDLAIDMVMYGSDYLLGLSTFAPEAFAKRDALWHAGDRRFYELNDLLQYLGALTFRDPAPAYKHSAAMFLKIRDMISTDHPHPDSPRRPDSDREILRVIATDLAQQMEICN